MIQKKGTYKHLIDQMAEQGLTEKQKEMMRSKPYQVQSDCEIIKQTNDCILTRNIEALADMQGKRHCITQCIEEMSELQQAFCKLIRIHDKDATCAKTEQDAMLSIYEEIADVEFTLTKVKYLLRLNEEQIRFIKKDKLARTKERLKRVE